MSERRAPRRPWTGHRPSDARPRFHRPPRSRRSARPSRWAATGRGSHRRSQRRRRAQPRRGAWSRIVGVSHGVLLARANLERQRPLAGLGSSVRLETPVDLVGEAEPVEPTGGEHDGVEPRVHAARSRVSMLPRSGSISSSGSASSCARRRIEAVPTTQSRRSSLLPAHRGRPPGQVRAHGKSVRVGRGHVLRRVDGHPLGAQAEPLRALDEHSTAADLAEGLAAIASPAVVTGTSANSSPGRRRRSTASLACVSASRLPLEPILMRTTTVLGGGRFLQAHDRLVQELVHDLARQRLDRVPLALREPREPWARLGQLASPDRFRALAERGDRRHGQVASQSRNRAASSTAIDSAAASRPRAVSWTTASRSSMSYRAVRQLVDRRIEISGDGQVDQGAAVRPFSPAGLGRARPWSARDRQRSSSRRGCPRSPPPPPTARVGSSRRRAPRRAAAPGFRAIGDEGEQRRCRRRPCPDLAGADDCDPRTLEIAEHLRRQRGRSGRSRAQLSAIAVSVRTFFPV